MAFGIPAPQGGMTPFSSLTQPQVAPEVGGPNFGPLAQAMNPPQLQAKPKMNWLGILADALAGAAGRQGPYATMLMQQRQQDMENSQYEHRQQSELQRQKDLYLWEQQNKADPAPTEYERALQAAGIKPGTPEYIKHMSNFVQMKENPTWTYTDPVTGAIMLGTKAPPQQPPILDTLPPGARPIGGQTPSASGGFPSGR
jgi:hypothetical protein